MSILNHKENYFSNIDGLRFLAFFAVFINHVVACLGHKTSDASINEFKTNYLLNGDLGVNFFFVLSGFLITWLLLKEKEKNNKIHILNFYKRRALRIWPLYFLILIIGFVIVPLFVPSHPVGFPISSSAGIERKDFYLFFLGNFDYIRNGISTTIVGVLWSVSIEEQFYLFWPLLISFIPKKHLTKTLFGLIAFSICYRMYGTSGVTLNVMLKYHTFSCLSDLAMGALFANLFMNEKIISRFKKIDEYWIILIYAIGIALIIFRTDIYNFDPIEKLQPRNHPHYIRAIMPVIYSLFFALVLMEQIFAEFSLFKIERIRLFTRLGRISYGLYCFHIVAMFIVIYVLMTLGFNVIKPDKHLILLEASAALLVTILLSWISYRYFETRFLSLKEKYATHFSKVQKKN